MRDKKAIAAELKKKNQFSNEAFAKFENAQQYMDIWDEIINDLSIPEEYASLAKTMQNSCLDLTNKDHIDMFCMLNNQTGKMEPAPLITVEPTKQGALMFLQQLNDFLSSGKEIYNFNLPANKEDKFQRLEKPGNSFRVSDTECKLVPPIAPDVVAKPNIFKTFTNKWFGWFKKDVDDYNKYAEEKSAYDVKLEKYNKETVAISKFLKDNREYLDQRKAEYQEYKGISDAIENDKTLTEKIEELIKQAEDREKPLQLATGRTKELIGRHENYKALAEIPINKVEGLPVEGLALLVANSVNLNKNIMDASSQFAQQFVPVAGNTLTAAEEAQIRQIERRTQVTNVGAKIMESFYSGIDIIRMGERGTAVVEGRKLLNSATEEYAKGNKQPLADLIKDSIDVVFDYTKELSSNSQTASGKAVIEIGNAVKKLFTDDPEIKEMVGASEENLEGLYGAVNFLKEIEDPGKKQLESINKNLDSGMENKAAYLKDMLYISYIKNIAKDQMRGIDSNIENIAMDKFMTEGEALRSKFDDKNMQFMAAYLLSEKSAIRTFPDIYYDFAKQPINDSKYKEAFEQEIVNSSAFKSLIDKPVDELVTLEFSKALEGIITSNELKKNAEKLESKLSKHIENVKESKKDDASIVLNPKDVYVAQQKLLGDMLNNPTDHGSGKNYMSKFTKCIGTMIAAKKLDSYLKENAGKLSKEQMSLLCSKKNIEEKGLEFAGSDAMKQLVSDGNPFVKKESLCALAIGAEKVLDKEKQPSTDATDISEAAISALADKVSVATKDIQIDSVLNTLKEPEIEAPKKDELVLGGMN